MAISMTYPLDLTRVALYLRKSRADVEAEVRGEGETLSKHRKALLEIAKKHRYNVRQVYEEIVSGERIVDRPQMQLLLEGVKSKQYSAVLCMDLDRLGRGNMIDQGLIQETFKTSSTLIITPRKVYDLDDELDEEWSEFEAFMARRELKIITRRMQRGRKMSAADGKCIGKKPPYGYTRDLNLKLVPFPEEARVVELIFQLRSEGLGRHAIANRLSDLRIPSPQGNDQWESVTVRDMLKNEAYIGRIVWGQYKHWKDDSGRKRKTLLPRDQWIVVENAHSAIVEHTIWNAVQMINQSKTPHTTIDYTLKNAFAGLIRCSECGKVMIRRSQAGRTMAKFLCDTYQCSTRSARYEDIEKRVIEQMLELSKILPQTDTTKDSNANGTNKIQALLHAQESIAHQLEQLSRQREKLHDLLEQQVYDIETFVERGRSINKRLESLTVDEIRVQKEIAETREHMQTVNLIIPGLAKVAVEYDNTNDVTLKNQLLKTVLKEIRYSRKKDWGLTKSFELEFYLRV